MDQTHPGRSGLSVSRLALGTMTWGRDTEATEAGAQLRAFREAGGTLVDTADVYAGGESERILGRLLADGGSRDDVLIATKVGMEMGPGKKGLSRAYILQAVEDSLRRLQTDHIDLYQSHQDDPETPLEETLGAFGDLIRQGKVRAIGASNFSAERLALSLDLADKDGLPRYDSLQPEYNLYSRTGFETKLQALLPVLT